LVYNTYILGNVTGNSLHSYLKQTKMSFFFLNEGQEGKSGPVEGLVLVGGGRI
jgi:hypothetical protein